MTLLRRSSGVVLHITSLPGEHGVGDLGQPAKRFVDWLAQARQSVWQMLPINPIGPGNSPYQSPSAFACSGLMVALQPLVDQGWLPATALTAVPNFNPARVDYEKVVPWRWALLRQAASGFAQRANASQREALVAWCNRQSNWLPEWSLFAALKDEHAGQPWWLWGPALAGRDPVAMAAARQRLAQPMAEHAFVQWCFEQQMRELRAYAHQHGVQLMGDLPIFVAHDSADVWSRPEHYFMDEQHQLTFVAGVPPDGFGPDGQRWGNPLYRWDRMADDGYAWWVARVQRAFVHADIVRIDHFRGFAGYWEVPASCPTAREGRWAPGPGQPLFTAIEAALGRLPIVAEDLGTITPDVVALRDHFGFPGMRIVQEAFGSDAQHPFLPHNHMPACLAYSSTHDSDTALGWWATAGASTRTLAREYLQCTDEQLHWALIRSTSHSVAQLALFPVQDVLGLDGSHRMNLPGTDQGNWSWRVQTDMLQPWLADELARITTASGRAVLRAPPAPPPPTAPRH